MLLLLLLLLLWLLEYDGRRIQTQVRPLSFLTDTLRRKQLIFHLCHVRKKVLQAESFERVSPRAFAALWLVGDVVAWPTLRRDQASVQPQPCISIIKNNGVALRGGRRETINVSRLRKALWKVSYFALREKNIHILFVWLIFNPRCWDDNKRDDKRPTGCYLPSSVFLVVNITSQLPTNGGTKMKTFSMSECVKMIVLRPWPPVSCWNSSRVPHRLKAKIVVQLKPGSGCLWKHLRMFLNGVLHSNICWFTFPGINLRLFKLIYDFCWRKANI